MFTQEKQRGSQRVNPFPGLRPFAQDESRFFFGRDRDVQAAIDNLRTRSFLAIIGPTGSGKSSLVRAGLLPMLGAWGKWRSTIMRPGLAPFRKLVEALANLPGFTRPYDLPQLGDLEGRVAEQGAESSTVLVQ